MTEPTVLDINGIMLRLPHRYPFLLVDRVLACERGQSIRALTRPLIFVRSRNGRG